MPAPAKMLVARFPGGYSENPDVTDWLVKTVCSMKEDIRISDIFHWRRTDTPITMSRNNAIEVAKTSDVDFILMVDNDMKPDAYLGNKINQPLGFDPAAEPFWDSAFDFLWRRKQEGERPAMIAAPYCGPPPHENVFMFHWANRESEHPVDQDLELKQFSREWASEQRGIQEVAAAPTGLILIDMDVFHELEPPYFYYEWTDKTQKNKASTEDVTFTRDSSLMGHPVFCNWNAWAGHWKMKCVGKPIPLTSRQISNQFEAAIMRKHLGVDTSLGERFIIQGSGPAAKKVVSDVPDVAEEWPEQAMRESLEEQENAARIGVETTEERNA